jgi:YebC/PmpR family DNA-binding regulatory protein
MSGHSKWANIKHKKAAKDAKRGKIFTRITKEMTIAAREGGGNIDDNPRLRLAVQNAKAANMPAENIKRAIQKGTGELEGVSYEEINYEGYAPCGVAVLLETVTDNRNRTLSEIRSQFSKLNGNLAEPGAVAWNFDRKGVVTVKTGNLSEEELFEHVIESGAEDLEYSEDSSRIICQYDLLSQCNKYFQDKKIEVEESKLEYIPKTLVTIDNVNDARKVMRLIEHFEDHDDVQNVFANCDIDDKIIEQVESTS